MIWSTIETMLNENNLGGSYGARMLFHFIFYKQGYPMGPRGFGMELNVCAMDEEIFDSHSRLQSVGLKAINLTKIDPPYVAVTKKFLLRITAKSYSHSTLP